MHEHLRKGTDCSICGTAGCPRYSTAHGVRATARRAFALVPQAASLVAARRAVRAQSTAASGGGALILDLPTAHRPAQDRPAAVEHGDQATGAL